MKIELAEITKDNVRDVFDLKVAPGQEQFVAANPWSLAQAFAERDIAWPRAIVADGAVVGFLMLEIDPSEEDGRPFWLWRLMIDASVSTQGIRRGGRDARRRLRAIPRSNRAVHLMGAG